MTKKMLAGFLVLGVGLGLAVMPDTAEARVRHVRVQRVHRHRVCAPRIHVGVGYNTYRYRPAYRYYDYAPSYYADDYDGYDYAYDPAYSAYDYDYDSAYDYYPSVVVRERHAPNYYIGWGGGHYRSHGYYSNRSHRGGGGSHFYSRGGRGSRGDRGDSHRGGRGDSYRGGDRGGRGGHARRR